EPHLVDGRMANMTVEIAIRAFRQAKRPVNIHPEGRLFLGNVICQGKPPRACEKRARGGTGRSHAAATRAFPRSTSRRTYARTRPEETSDRSRSPCRRAAAISACRRPLPQTLRHARQAKQERAR